MNYINETTVLDFYLSQIEEDKIKFLQDREELKEEVKKNVIQLRGAEDLHEKIEVAKKLWKALFKASMSYIDSDMRGYDDLFKYFDEYVNFEELIFASDSFYRDHTMHCLWVYFLGEYLFKNESFDELFKEYNYYKESLSLANACKKSKNTHLFKELVEFLDQMCILEYHDSMRCLAALTHDLGYPLKKVSKINSCISRIMPYFSLKKCQEFDFNFDIMQQGFVETFIKCMSMGVDNVTTGEEEEFKSLAGKIFKLDSNYIVTDINEDEINKLTEEQQKIIKKSIGLRSKMKENLPRKMRFFNDFEQQQHGIMSAYLLVKTVKAFTNTKLMYYSNIDIPHNGIDLRDYIVKYTILGAIADHDSEGYTVRGIEELSQFLILIDELEEFSRISRANMNRQYVEEFCKSNIYFEEGTLNIDFIFDNENIANLDPERAFKGRCNRFLSLFNIKNLSENLRIRLRCIGKLPYDDNVYTLEIGRKYANITINGEEQNIPKYLKSSEFYTKEMYMKL